MREIIAAARNRGGRPCNVSQQKPPQNFAEVSDPKEERKTNARLGALAERMREIIAAQAQQRIKAGMSLSIQDNPPQSFGEVSGPKERETDARLGALAGVSRTAQHAATATRIHSPGLRARAEGYTTTSYSEDGEERMRRKRKQRLSMKDLGGSYPVYRRYGPEPLPERSGEREERGEQAREDHQREEDRA
jgi:hypothetical protein